MGSEVGIWFRVPHPRGGVLPYDGLGVRTSRFAKAPQPNNSLGSTFCLCLVKTLGCLVSGIPIGSLAIETKNSISLLRISMPFDALHCERDGSDCLPKQLEHAGIVGRGAER